MVLALSLVGLLFGIALTVTVAVFAILSMGGGFGDNLRAAALQAQRRLTGRHRPIAAAAAPGRVAEADARVRGLQEEVKVMQKLLEQGRVERDQQQAAGRKVADEVATLREALAGRDARVAELEDAARAGAEEALRLREEVGLRSAELAAARRELRDLETELSVARSGSDFTGIPEELARLCRERDDLAARVEQLSRGAPVPDGAVPASG